MSARPRLFVGTPTANGFMMADYVTSLTAMMSRLHEAGIGARFRCIDGPSLATQRDMLAHEFLAGDASHLLLIDGHMAFAPDLATAMLRADKPLIGTVCARGAIDLRRLGRELAGREFDAAAALAHGWAVEMPAGPVSVADGLCRVEALGAGFLLIERACLEQMIAGGAVPRYRAFDETVLLHGFSRPLPGAAEAGSADDFQLARRWRSCGGEVWAYTQAKVRRIADMRYGMPFSRYLRALARDPAKGADGAVARAPAS